MQMHNCTSSWNYLGDILRMDERRVTRQVPLQCVKTAPESLFRDVPDLNVYTAINLAISRVEWKEIDYLDVANLT